MQGEQPPVDSLWTLYTPPLAGQTGTSLSPGPKKQRIEAKDLERIPRRSCHQHNPSA